MNSSSPAAPLLIAARRRRTPQVSKAPLSPPAEGLPGADACKPGWLTDPRSVGILAVLACPCMADTLLDPSIRGGTAGAHEAGPPSDPQLAGARCGFSLRSTCSAAAEVCQTAWRPPCGALTKRTTGAWPLAVCEGCTVGADIAL